MALPNMLQFAPFSGCPRALQDKESNMDFGQAKGMSKKTIFVLTKILLISHEHQ
jgi:hypothetical protein